MDYMDDPDAFEGPDAYVEDDYEYDVEDQFDEDDTAEEAEEYDDDDGDRGAQRQSIVDLLNNAFVSAAPSSDSAGGNETLVTSSLTLEQIRLLLAAAQSGGLGRNIRLANEDDEDEDPDYIPPHEEEDGEDDSSYYTSFPFARRRPHSAKTWFKPVAEPQEAGVHLLHGGEFGRLSAKKTRNIRRSLKERESRIARHGQGFYKEDFARDLVPNADGTVVASYGSNAYSGQYSADSSFYYTCCQDWRLHVYDTKAPLDSISRDADRQRRRLGDDYDHETTMKTIKTVQAIPGSWTITDVGREIFNMLS